MMVGNGESQKALTWHGSPPFIQFCPFDLDDDANFDDVEENDGD